MLEQAVPKVFENWDQHGDFLRFVFYQDLMRIGFDKILERGRTVGGEPKEGKESRRDAHAFGVSTILVECVLQKVEGCSSTR